MHKVFNGDGHIHLVSIFIGFGMMMMIVLIHTYLVVKTCVCKTEKKLNKTKETKNLSMQTDSKH